MEDKDFILEIISAKNRSKSSSERSKPARDLQMLEQKILVNQESLDTSSKLLAENYENLLETSDAKLQLIAEIQALEINLEDKNFEERNLRLEKLNELSEQNKSLLGSFELELAGI